MKRIVILGIASAILAIIGIIIYIIIAEQKKSREELLRKQEEEKKDLIQKQENEKKDLTQQQQNDKQDLNQKHQNEQQDLSQKHQNDKQDLTQKHQDEKQDLTQKHQDEKKKYIENCMKRQEEIVKMQAKGYFPISLSKDTDEKSSAHKRYYTTTYTCNGEHAHLAKR